MLQMREEAGEGPGRTPEGQSILAALYQSMVLTSFEKSLVPTGESSRVSVSMSQVTTQNRISFVTPPEFSRLPRGGLSSVAFLLDNPLNMW